MNNRIWHDGNFFHFVTCVILPAVMMVPTLGCLSVRNTVIETSKATQRLSIDQPKPAWQTKLQGREVDIMRFIEDDRILIGTFHVNYSNVLNFVSWHFPKDITLFDLKSGHILWNYPRDQFGNENHSVIATTPHIIVRVDNPVAFSLHAINVKTGKLQWQWKGKAQGKAILISPTKAITASINESKLDVVLLNLTNGNELWQCNLEDLLADSSNVFELRPMQQSVLIIGKKLTMCSLENGSVLWSKPVVPSSVVFTTDDKVFLANKNSLIELEATDGKECWSAPISVNTARLIAPLGDIVVVVNDAPNDEKGVILTGVDFKSGTVRWKYAVHERIASAIMRDENNLFFTTPSHLISLTIADGKELFSSSIPVGLVTENALPDILKSNNHTIVIDRETGIARYDEQSGKLLFNHSLPEGRGFTYEYLASRPSLVNKEIAAKLPIGSTIQPLPSSNLDWAYKNAQNYQHYVYTSTEQTLRSPSSSSQEKTSALNRRESAATNTMNEGIKQAQLEFAMAAAQFGATVGSAIVTVIVSEVLRHNTQELIQRPAMKVCGAIITHHSSLNGSLYVRPFYKNGWRLAVVDFEKGMRADILLSPPNRGIGNPKAANLPTFAVDPERGILIAKGLGLDPVQYNETYKIGDWMDELSNIGWIIPYPSIMLYGIKNLPFHKVDMDNTESVMRSPVDKALLDALKDRNIEALRKALDAGANPNTKDSLGRTALMIAIGSYNHKAIRLLGERGADPNIEDIEGYSAWNYLLIFINIIPENITVKETKQTREEAEALAKRLKKSKS